MMPVSIWQADSKIITVTYLFKGPLLGFWDEKEDHEEGNDVESSIEAECTDDVKRFQDLGECDGENCGPEETCSNCKAHTNLAVREREYFCRVSEGDGPFTRGVEGGEEEDEERDTSKMSCLFFGDPERESGCEQRPCHLRKCEQKQRSPAERIDRKERRESENKVNETES